MSIKHLMQNLLLCDSTCHCTKVQNDPLMTALQSALSSQNHTFSSVTPAEGTVNVPRAQLTQGSLFMGTRLHTAYSTPRCRLGRLDRICST